MLLSVVVKISSTEIRLKDKKIDLEFKPKGRLKKNRKFSELGQKGGWVVSRNHNFYTG